VSAAAVAVCVLILAAALIADVMIDHARRIDRDHDRDQRHRDLMRELRRHEGPRWRP
jgi:hypothetical protein